MSTTSLVLFTQFTGASPPPVTSTNTAAISFLNTELDAVDGGGFKIVGTTKKVGSPGIPVSRYVRLHDSLSGRVVRAQWSDSVTGVYSFKNLRFGNFYVMAEDYTRMFNGVIVTNITSELM